jgi:TetR/AcrR family transcriptional regulator, transcriptional repressor for nem operon
MAGNEGGTRQVVLDAAQELAQRHGYNGFSYHELARRVGIKTASIHYYFPTKEDLGCVLMARYREQFANALSAIHDGSKSQKRMIERFIELFERTLASGDRLCLCGMLASEYGSLPDSIRAEVRRFFEESEAWLTGVLKEGRQSGAFRFDGPPALIARTLVSSLEGAMIAARTFDDASRLTATGAWLLKTISPKPASREVPTNHKGR